MRGAAGLPALCSRWWARHAAMPLLQLGAKQPRSSHPMHHPPSKARHLDGAIGRHAGGGGHVGVVVVPGVVALDGQQQLVLLAAARRLLQGALLGVRKQGSARVQHMRLHKRRTPPCTATAVRLAPSLWPETSAWVRSPRTRGRTLRQPRATTSRSVLEHGTHCCSTGSSRAGLLGTRPGTRCSSK